MGEQSPELIVSGERSEPDREVAPNVTVVHAPARLSRSHEFVFACRPSGRGGDESGNGRLVGGGTGPQSSLRPTGEESSTIENRMSDSDWVIPTPSVASSDQSSFATLLCSRVSVAVRDAGALPESTSTCQASTTTPAVWLQAWSP